jgi:hypothetical protein
MFKKRFRLIALAVFLLLASLGGFLLIGRPSSSLVNNSSTPNPNTSTPSNTSNVTTSNGSTSDQPVISLLAGIKGSYTNLVVNAFVKSGTNRIYVVSLSDPAVGSTPASGETKIVITSNTAVLFEKQLSTRPSTNPNFTNAVLFDENHLLISYYAQATATTSQSVFNLNTHIESGIGDFRVSIIPDNKVDQPLLKNKTFVLVGSKGSNHGIFKLNDDLTTTFLTPIPEAFVKNTEFQTTQNYNYPLISIYSDNTVRGDVFTPRTKILNLVLKTADFSIVYSGEKTTNQPSLGTEYSLNFFTNAISIRETIDVVNPNNAFNSIRTETLFVYDLDGNLKVNQPFDSNYTSFAGDFRFLSGFINYSLMFTPIPITGLTIGRRVGSTNEIEFFMYDATLTEIRTFKMIPMNLTQVKVDSSGNVQAIVSATGISNFIVYTPNGTDFTYSKDAKSLSLRYDIYSTESSHQNLPVTRSRVPLLIETLNDNTINVIRFSNGQFRVFNAPIALGTGSLQGTNYQMLSNDEIIYMTISVYTNLNEISKYHSVIINQQTDTVLVADQVFPKETLRPNSNVLYSNGYIVDSVLDSVNYESSTVGLIFVNISTASYHYVAFSTPFSSYMYPEEFSRNNDGTFTLGYSGSGGISGTITGTTANLATVTVTPSSGGMSFFYTGVFENILNTIDFAFRYEFVQPTETTPPSTISSYYVGTDYNGSIKSLTQVTGSLIPTSPMTSQLVVFNPTGTDNDRLFLYFPFMNLLVDLLSPTYATLNGYFTQTGFTLIDANFNEIDDYIPLPGFTSISFR